MTVAELVHILQQYPENTSVDVSMEGHGQNGIMHIQFDPRTNTVVISSE